MNKCIFWTGIAILVIAVIIFFLSGSTSGPSPELAKPTVSFLYGTNQFYWILLGFIGIIIAIVGAFLKPKMKFPKKGAIELSIGTIVIIVLAMTMLILGMVLVRSIMCGAIGLTGDINSKVSGEINKLFDASGSEVACIGAGTEPITMVPGKTNTIYCSIKANQQAEYQIKVKSIRGDILKESEIRKWIVGDDFYKRTVAPNDDDPKKFLRLNIPNNAPLDSIIIGVEVYKDGNLIASPDLDFQIKSLGLIKAAIC